uniref:Mediator of RNA polymerase II transcription subunit 7 n=2 Tax=Rhodosorus marinus TaxID=101924 RepID=A0A7S3E8B0_9RHOD|mmetsp:Transcript_16916/g.69062  ORF Transcript_16916/g.69062 Transcript_16916/m.69062 type:complete len:267 (+) Transcript_16916:224-1024(+)
MADNEFVSQWPAPPAMFFRDGVADKVPPKAPAQGGTYSMFGDVYTTEDKLPSLEESGRKVLYDPKEKYALPTNLQRSGWERTNQDYSNRFLHRRTVELRKLNKMLLNKFLKLVQSLCSNPNTEAYRTEVEEIENVLINMHHLANTLRTDQAHQTVKRQIERQTELRSKALSDLDKAFDEARGVLRSARNMLQESSDMSIDAQNLDKEVLDALSKAAQEVERVKPPTDEGDANEEPKPAAMTTNQDIIAEMEKIVPDNPGGMEIGRL